MSIRNQNWYNLQSTRRYPLDDSSTGVSDTGGFIPDDILVDCHIRFPSTYGNNMYVQGITVSPSLVTVVFGISPDAGPGETAAAITLQKPVTPNINYPITGLRPGVSGWVVFGAGTNTTFTGRYTNAAQTLIAPRCARKYVPLPVPTIGKNGLATALQGVVRLVGAAPVRVRHEANAGRVVYTDAVDGISKTLQNNVDAFVIELDPTQITDTYNPLSEFLGPCSQRPESRTCVKPPIETINNIRPDCNGNIDIIFEGFDAAELFENCGGIDVLTDKNLPDLCAAVQPRRPTANDDCCVPALEVATEAALAAIPPQQRTVGMVVVTLDTNERWRLDGDLTTWRIDPTAAECGWPNPVLKPDIIIDELIPPTSYPVASLPVNVNFSAPSAAALFTTQRGAFASDNQLVINDDRTTFLTQPVYQATKLSSLNLATFNNAATDWAAGKTISAKFRVASGGVKKIGGIVLNYHTALNASSQLQTKFVAVVLDGNLGSARVLRYTNTAVTVEGSAAFVVKPGAWYRVSAATIVSGETAAINVYIEELTTINPATVSLIVNVARTAYGDLIGRPGLIADSSQTYFSNFGIEGSP